MQFMFHSRDIGEKRHVEGAECYQSYLIPSNLKFPFHCICNHPPPFPSAFNDNVKFRTQSSTPGATTMQSANGRSLYAFCHAYSASLHGCTKPSKLCIREQPEECDCQRRDNHATGSAGIHARDWPCTKGYYSAGGRRER